MGDAEGSYFPNWSVDGIDWPLREWSDFLEAGRHRWHIQRRGKGPKILFLHGTGAATHSWAPVARILADQFEVLVLDLPGHGFTRSTGYAAPTLPGVAGAVSGLLQEAAFFPDAIVGHSAGAAIMLQMALDRHVRPRISIGVNSALQPFPGPARYIFPAAAKLLFLNPFAPYLFAQRGGTEGRVRRLIEGTGSHLKPDQIAPYATLLRRPGHIEGALRLMANWDLSTLQQRLPEVDAAVHLIASANDRAVPPADLEENRQLVPGATATLLPDYGHLAHEEAPAEFAALLRRMVDGA
ncbi:MAG: alpha/beta fold hydrolase [Alphaproteobacteria bacterium]|nr:alpha/beta fold hydrolase [Alphaproteobacteria bacterium]